MEELIKKALEEMKLTFEQFKKTNDEKLKELATKGHADPLLTEKVEKLNARLTELDELKESLEKALVKSGRPSGLIGGGDQATIDQLKHKEKVVDFIRKGEGLDGGAGLRELQRKAMNMTTPEEGGFAIPTDLDREILSLMRVENVMRQICNVITVGTSDYKKLVNKHGATVGWVGETDTRPQTGTPNLAQLVPYMGEIYAMPAATQQNLDDSFFSVEAFLSEEIAAEFAEEEETVFVSGNGTKKPKGFLDYAVATTADGTRAFGTLQYRATGTAGGFRPIGGSPVGNPADDIIDLVGDLKKKMLSGAVFLACKAIYTAIRKFKDANGNYIWQPSIQAGKPDLLLGYPAIICEAMPGLVSGASALAFGNFKRGYKIVDRMGTRVLRDPFTAKPYILFYTTKRVGGMVEDSEAIKILKLSAS